MKDTTFGGRTKRQRIQDGLRGTYDRGSMISCSLLGSERRAYVLDYSRRSSQVASQHELSG